MAHAQKARGLFDVVVDSAGGPDFPKLVDATAAGGRLVIYGATRGEAPLPLRKIFWRHQAGDQVASLRHGRCCRSVVVRGERGEHGGRGA